MIPPTTLETTVPQSLERTDVVRAQNGDTRAFERLYQAHAGRVLGLARRMIGPDLASEITLPEDFDFETSHARVEELRTRLDSFGAVNMMALEELAEAEERLLFLTVQRQDIVEGIAATWEWLRCRGW